MSNVMSNIIDPCNPYPICSATILIVVLIMGLQVTGFCNPVLDYVKFTVVTILMYFYYQVVIKQKPALCGMDGMSMWSCICWSMMVGVAILTGLCVRLQFPGVMIGYVLLIFCILPCTLTCMFRLYHSKGPFTSEFLNPATITKVYM